VTAAGSDARTERDAVSRPFAVCVLALLLLYALSERRWFCWVSRLCCGTRVAPRPFFTRAPAVTSPWHSGSWRRPAATRHRSTTAFVSVSLFVCWLRCYCASSASDAGSLGLAVWPGQTLHRPSAGVRLRSPRYGQVARDAPRHRCAIGARQRQFASVLAVAACAGVV
jgi:hypothetical protein